MPRTCVFDTEKGAIFVKASGVFTETEFRLGAETTVKDPRFHPDMRTLVDFSGVTQFKIPAQTLMDFVDGRHFSKAARRAFVVAPGFGRVFVTFGASGAQEHIRIFDSRKAAIAWLNEGMPPEKALV